MDEVEADLGIREVDDTPQNMVRGKEQLLDEEKKEVMGSVDTFNGQGSRLS